MFKLNWIGVEDNRIPTAYSEFYIHVSVRSVAKLRIAEFKGWHISHEKYFSIIDRGWNYGDILVINPMNFTGFAFIHVRLLYCEPTLRTFGGVYFDFQLQLCGNSSDNVCMVVCCRGHDYAWRDGGNKNVFHTWRHRRGAGGQRPRGGGHVGRRQLLRWNVFVGVGSATSRQRTSRDILQPVLAVGHRVRPGRGQVSQVQGPRVKRADRQSQPDGQHRQAIGQRERRTMITGPDAMLDFWKKLKIWLLLRCVQYLCFGDRYKYIFNFLTIYI